MAKKIAFRCNSCGNPIYIGDIYFAFEFGKFKILPNKEEGYETDQLNIQELFIFCQPCAIGDIFHRINGLIS